MSTPRERPREKKIWVAASSHTWGEKALANYNMRWEEVERGKMNKGRVMVRGGRSQGEGRSRGKGQCQGKGNSQRGRSQEERRSPEINKHTMLHCIFMIQYSVLYRGCGLQPNLKHDTVTSTAKPYQLLTFPHHQIAHLTYSVITSKSWLCTKHCNTLILYKTITSSQTNPLWKT